MGGRTWRGAQAWANSWVSPSRWARRGASRARAWGGAPPGADLHELKTYVTSRLLWNSSRVPLQEISEFLVLYYGKNGAASVKLYMDTMIQSVKAIGYCRADDGRSLGFPPPAPFLTPAAVLTSAHGVATARALADRGRLAAVGELARKRAGFWTEQAHGRVLLTDHLRPLHEACAPRERPCQIILAEGQNAL